MFGLEIPKNVMMKTHRSICSLWCPWFNVASTCESVPVPLEDSGSLSDMVGALLSSESDPVDYSTMLTSRFTFTGIMQS